MCLKWYTSRQVDVLPYFDVFRVSCFADQKYNLAESFLCQNSIQAFKRNRETNGYTPKLSIRTNFGV